VVGVCVVFLLDLEGNCFEISKEISLFNVFEKIPFEKMKEKVTVVSHRNVSRITPSAILSSATNRRSDLK